MSDYVSPSFQTGQEVDDALLAGLKSKSALADVIDGGQKNRLTFNNLDMVKQQNTGGSWIDNVYEFRGVTYTINSDFSIVATGKAVGGNANLILSPMGGFSIEEGQWVLSGCPQGGSAGTYNIAIASTVSDIGNAISFTSCSSKIVRIYIIENTEVDNLIFKPMICSKAAWDISQKYAPYRPSYQEMYERILALESQNT